MLNLSALPGFQPVNAQGAKDATNLSHGLDPVDSNEPTDGKASTGFQIKACPVVGMWVI